MSQYQSPYSLPPNYPPVYGYDPTAQLGAPARRAGLLMIIVGALIACYGVCNGISPFILSKEQLAAQSQTFSTQGAAVLPPERLATIVLIFSAIILLIGIACIVCGALVRGGSRAATIIGLVLTSMMLLLVGVATIAFLVGAMISPMLLIGACVTSIPLSLLILQLVWLIQAARARGTIAAMQMQRQAQLWQYQQMQQAYGQGGAYGYPTQPPPPPPSPSPGDAGGHDSNDQNAPG